MWGGVGVGWGGVGWGGVGDSGAWSWASSMRCHLELDGWMDGQTGRQINRQADIKRSNTQRELTSARKNTRIKT